jgi:hypothetical protein
VTRSKSAADVDNHDHGLFQEVAANLVRFKEDNPQVQTPPVGNSTVHNVQEGRQRKRDSINDEGRARISML